MSNTNNNNTRNDEWKEKELGILYKQQSKDGKKQFLSGTINGVKVVIFSNKTYKDKRVQEAQGEEEQEKARRIPDYTVYKSEELNGGNNAGQASAPAQTRRPQATNSRPPSARPQQRSAPPRAATQAAPGPLGEVDDIPY